MATKSILKTNGYAKSGVAAITAVFYSDKKDLKKSREFNQSSTISKYTQGRTIPPTSTTNNRTYMLLWKEGTAFPKPPDGFGKGKYAYVAKLEGIYNQDLYGKQYQSDIDESASHDEQEDRLTAQEEALLENGFNGYTNGDFVVVLSNNLNISNAGAVDGSSEDVIEELPKVKGSIRQNKPSTKKQTQIQTEQLIPPHIGGGYSTPSTPKQMKVTSAGGLLGGSATTAGVSEGNEKLADKIADTVATTLLSDTFIRTFSGKLSNALKEFNSVSKEYQATRKEEGTEEVPLGDHKKTDDLLTEIREILKTTQKGTETERDTATNRLQEILEKTQGTGEESRKFLEETINKAIKHLDEPIVVPKQKTPENKVSGKVTPQEKNIQQSELKEKKPLALEPIAKEMTLVPKEEEKVTPPILTKSKPVYIKPEEGKGIIHNAVGAFINRNKNVITTDENGNEVSKTPSAMKIGYGKRFMRNTDLILGKGETGKMLRDTRNLFKKDVKPSISKESGVSTEPTIKAPEDITPKDNDDSTGIGLGDAADVAEGAGKLLGKGSGWLGKLGGAAKFGGRLLGKVAAPIAIGLAAKDAYDGYNEAGSNFDLKEGQEATTGQKWSSAAGSAVSGLSMGLLDKKSMSQGIGHFFGAGDDGVKPETSAISDNAIDNQVNATTQPAPIVVNAPQSAPQAAKSSVVSNTITMTQRPNEGAYKAFVNNRYVG